MENNGTASVGTHVSSAMITDAVIRHDWTKEQIARLFNQSFNDLLFQAQQIHRAYFDPNAVQISTLLSIKTGRCAEDCSYCSQSVRYDTDLDNQPLMPLNEVVEAAKLAKENGASRFCMGAAWRCLNAKDEAAIIAMITAVKSLGMETCMTLGMLTKEQAQILKKAGLDYYNHNLDTSPEFYGEVITTRTYQDRLDTLSYVREAEINICSGGILGMGEKRQDRIALLQQLVNLPQHPESVPINLLVQIEGTPLYGAELLDPLEFVRTVAVARILMPASVVRLSAGREKMTDEMQALCFFAGANSIFYGDRLLTTDNPKTSKDQQLFQRLGIHALQ